MQSQTAVSLVALTAELVHNNAFHSILAQSFPDIVDVRNIFLTTFYDMLPNATHMLFVDADMQFEPKLVVDMLKADKPLVGCLYPKKRYPIEWVGSALKEMGKPDENGLLELAAVGCGVMLIRRDCVTEMIHSGQAKIQTDTAKTQLRHMIEGGADRIIRAFDKLIDEDGGHLSEDFSFCYRHRKSGGKVYATIDHTLVHIGMHQYAGKYSDLYKRGEAQQDNARSSEVLLHENADGVSPGPRP